MRILKRKDAIQKEEIFDGNIIFIKIGEKTYNISEKFGKLNINTPYGSIVISPEYANQITIDVIE